MNASVLRQRLVGLWFSMVVGVRQDFMVRVTSLLTWWLDEEQKAEARRRRRNILHFLHVSHLISTIAVSVASGAFGPTRGYWSYHR